MTMRSSCLFLVLVAAAAAAYAAEPTARDTRLIDAVKSGDSAAAITLLQKKIDVNASAADGTTALHWAVRNGDASLVDRLIRAGADATATTRYGVTPIALACENGSAPLVERLLKAGVSPNTTAPLGETALHLCARTGNAGAVRVLLAAGATVDPIENWRGQTPLMWAAAEGHADAMRLLIEAGADVDARSSMIVWARQRTEEPRDKWLPPGGLTPLLFAARDGKAESARVLLSAGADVNIVDPDRHTPVILALMNGHFDVAAVLIQHGADVNMEDKVGRTALYAAVDAHTVPSSNRPAPRETDDRVSSFEIVQMLLDRGARVDAPLRAQLPYRTKLDRGGDGVLGAGTTPLIRAAKSADVPVIELLLARGANPKAATRNGVNAIMMAAGVAAREEDMTGRNKTPKEIIEAIRQLKAAGTDMNAADTQGRTAAHGAALWGLTEVVRFLHQNGADLNARDKRGLTALDHAMGLAGGFGFDGRSGVVREETARVIRGLGGTAGEPIANAPTGRRPQGDRSQDDPQDGERN
jgi:ankyrin repeat protein